MRIRIEVEDKGMKSVYEFESQELEGEDLRDRIVNYLAASGVFAEKESLSQSDNHIYDASGTLMDRLERFIKFEFPSDWFTTQHLKDRYETVSDDIKLSTVSTYLSRMNREGILERTGNRNNRQYRVVQNVRPELAEHHILQSKKRSAEGRL
jgi:hypothetical protein